MFGWTLIRDSEVAIREQLAQAQVEALQNQILSLKDYIGKAERLLEHERERIDQERERADRIADSLFQSQGLAPTSVTVVREQQAAEKIAAGKRADFMEELAEIYGETMDELVDDGAEPVPEAATKA